MAFVCHICGKSFTTSEKLKYHRRCHGEEQIKCHICDEMFTGKRVFNNHIQSHQTFECSVCYDTIKTYSRTSHSNKCAPIKGKSFNCSECPYVVYRQDRLKKHIENKHSTPSIQKFECTFCKVELSSASNLKAHDKNHAPPPAMSSPELQCNICNSTFASKKSLYVHNHKYHSNTKVVSGL